MGKPTDVPDEAELESYYASMSDVPSDPGDLIEPELDDPLDVAKRYYKEDNRPVLYTGETEPESVR